MFGSRLHDERGSFNAAGQVGALFEGDRTRANDLTGDHAIDVGRFRKDRIQKLHAGSFFHTQFLAADFSQNTAVIPDDQTAGAIHGSIELSQHNEVVALNGHTGNGAPFLDDDVTPGLNAFLPTLGNFVIQQTDIGAAARALGGLGIASHFVGMVAAQAGDVP